MKMIVQRLFHENVIPACSTAAVLVAGNIVDAAVTGQCLGKEAVAAFGLTNPILLGVIGLSGMLGVGMVIESGHALGRGEKDDVRSVFASSLSAGVALGTLLMLLLFAFSGLAAVAMGADETLAAQAADYLKGYSFGIPAFFLQSILGFIMPLDGDKKRVVIAMGASTAVNIALDFLNGFVVHGGLYGMALATSISYWVEFAVLLLHFRRKEKLFHFSLVPFRFHALSAIVRNGVPYALQLMMRMLGIILINRIILSFSTMESVAVFSLLMSSANLILIDGTAVGTTVLTVENCFVGERDYRSVAMLMRTAAIHSILVNLILSGVFILAAPWILRLFTRDPSIYGPAVYAFRLFATCPAIYALNYAFRSHLQSIRRISASVIYASFDVLIGPVAAAFCLSRLIGLDGIWLCYSLGEFLALTGLFISSVIRNRRVSLHFSDYLFLDPEWKREADESLSIFIERKEEALIQATKASEKAIGFMLQHGADSRQANMLGLCTEEICSNVVRHGFRKPWHLLELSLKKRLNEWILSIRDNCAYFNLCDYLSIQDQQKEKNGLRLVKGMAHDVQYMSALKINHVVIRIQSQTDMDRRPAGTGRKFNET